MINIGGDPNQFIETCKLFVSGTSIHAPQFNLITSEDWNTVKDSEIILLSLHANAFTGEKNLIDSINTKLFKKIPESAKIIVSVFGDAEILKQIETKNIAALILGKENNPIAQNRVSQGIFGALSFSGKITQDISSKDQLFNSGNGLTT